MATDKPSSPVVAATALSDDEIRKYFFDVAASIADLKSSVVDLSARQDLVSDDLATANAAQRDISGIDNRVAELERERETREINTQDVSYTPDIALPNFLRHILQEYYREDIRRFEAAHNTKVFPMIGDDA